jgi:hypothetical protein
MLHKIVMPVASNGYLLMCKLQSEVSVLPVSLIMVRALLLLAYTKQTLPLIGCS